MAVIDRFRLDGKVIVITGASSGFGAVCATEFASAGAHVVLAARRADRTEELAAKIRADGGQALGVRCDVGDPADCTAVAAAAVTEFGRIDGLLNNAGIAGAQPATRETPEHFRTIVDVNLLGAYWMAQSVGRVMQAGASIVNVSSVLAQTTAGLPQAAYSASKAGLLGLTRDLAQQWSGRKGIRVNALLPGYFPTEMTGEFEPGYLEQIAGTRVPLGRLGDADECAAAALFLLSPAASYITGATLAVDGGLLVT